MLPAFFWKDISWLGAYCAAILCALFFVSHIYPLHFFLGDGEFFLSGDAALHVSGWLFYAKDDWHFPLLFTERLNYPEGVSIAFTDSIPLAGLFFKLFHDYLPVNFNYIGLWHGLVYVCQALTAALFVRVLGGKSLFAVLVAVFFALTWPTLTWRIGHTSLMTHGLIIASLCCYFAGRSRQISAHSTFILLLALLLLAILTHPYLFALCFAIFAAFLGDEFLSGEDFYLQLRRFLLALSLMLVVLFVFGYLGNSFSADGFDFFSMNLSSPFCGGHFIQCSFDATGGQFEGFQYFGLGFLLLLGACLFYLLSSQQFSVAWREFYSKKRALLWVFLALFLFAVSNRIYLGSFMVLHYPIPDFVDKVANIFRSSGRFFWPVSYAILFGTLAFLLQLQRVRYVLLICIACVIQWFDTTNLRKSVVNLTHKPAASRRVEQLTDIFVIADSVFMYPIAGCREYDLHYYLDLQMAAALASTKFNTGYLARPKTDCVRKEVAFNESPMAGVLYVSPIDFLLGAVDVPTLFVSQSALSRCVVAYDLVACGKNELIDKLSLITSVKLWNHGDWQLKKSFFFDADSLLYSSIGSVKNEVLSVDDTSSSGFLSYGPYIDLSAGSYLVSLDYLSTSSSGVSIGFWDVFSAPSWGTAYHTYPLLGTSGVFVKTSHKVHITDSIKKFEVRTFYSGSDGLSVRSVSISKLN